MNEYLERLENGEDAKVIILEMSEKIDKLNDLQIIGSFECDASNDMSSVYLKPNAFFMPNCELGDEIDVMIGGDVCDIISPDFTTKRVSIFICKTNAN